MMKRALQAAKKPDSQASTGTKLTQVLGIITPSELVTDYLGFSVPINIPSNVTAELTALLTRFLELAIQNFSRGPNILSKLFVGFPKFPQAMQEYLKPSHDRVLTHPSEATIH